MPAQAGCLARIQTSMQGLKPAERAVASFVVENAARVVRMSISELSRDAGAGESTVFRLCRALGYDGYQEFKLRLAQDLVEPVGFIHEDVSFQDSIEDLAQKIFNTNAKAVEDTRRVLHPAMVDAAALAISRARRVDIYGVGYSSFTALDVKLKFSRLGLMADSYADSHVQVMAASALTTEDVAVGISHSGSTRDVIDVLGAAHKIGATTIAITNFSPSPITKVSDIVLLTCSPETPLGGEVLTSRIAQLCVIDVLSVAVATRLGEKCLEYARKASEAVRKKRY